MVSRLRVVRARTHFLWATMQDHMVLEFGTTQEHKKNEAQTVWPHDRLIHGGRVMELEIEKDLSLWKDARTQYTTLVERTAKLA